MAESSDSGLVIITSTECIVNHRMGRYRLERFGDARHQMVINQEGGRQPQNYTGGTVLEKLDTYNLILKLGQLGAYDSSRRIRGENGEYVQNTDIAHLIEEAMRPSRVVNGADQFIDLLVSCKVDPSIIVNDTLRSKLVRRMDELANNDSGDDTVIYDRANDTDTDEENENDNDDAHPSQRGRGVGHIVKKYRLEERN